MNQLDSIIEKMIFTINKEYEFDTFLIGATLPAQLYEREDKIRARFKIRGRENIVPRDFAASCRWLAAAC